MSTAVDIIGALRTINQAALTFEQVQRLMLLDEPTELDVDIIINEVESGLDESLERLNDE